MGNCCKNNSEGPAPHPFLHNQLISCRHLQTDINLAVPSTWGIEDKYRLFELSLPFSRIQINHFMVKVKIAETQAGGEGFVTLQTLRGELDTPAWKDLENENSTLSKFLLSSAFKEDGQGADEIDKRCLQIFAILNSPGSAADKTEHVYNLL